MHGRRKPEPGRRLCGVLAALRAGPWLLAGCAGQERQTTGTPTSAASSPASPSTRSARQPAQAGRVVRTYPVPGAFNVATGYGAVWVASWTTYRLTRADPRTGTLRSVAVGGTPSVPNTLPFVVAVGAGSVWVSNPHEGRVYRVDPTTLRVTARIRVGQEPWGIAFGEGFLWVADHRGPEHGALVQVDPRSQRVVRRLPLGPGAQGPGHVAVGDGAVWVAVDGDNTVDRVDPRTGRVLVVIPAHGVCGSITTGAGVWFSSRICGQQVTRIDPRSNKVVAEIPMTGDTLGVGVGFGSAWVSRMPENPAIIRIDAATNRVIGEVALGNGGVAGVTVGLGFVWGAGHDQLVQIEALP